MSTSLSSLSCGLEEVASILSGCRHSVWVWIGLMVLLGLLSIVPNICWECISRRLFSRARRWVSSLQSIFSLLVLNVDTADNSMRRGGEVLKKGLSIWGCCWAHFKNWTVPTFTFELSPALRRAPAVLCVCFLLFIIPGESRDRTTVDDTKLTITNLAVWTTPIYSYTLCWTKVLQLLYFSFQVITFIQATVATLETSIFLYT